MAVGRVSGDHGKRSMQKAIKAPAASMRIAMLAALAFVGLAAYSLTW